MDDRQHLAHMRCHVGLASVLGVGVFALEPNESGIKTDAGRCSGTPLGEVPGDATSTGAGG